ncbi:MAG TPA: hypothetical protein VLW50_00095 [Streptosporangiaceae bacterium]|nr:hypothetical protein [Streptosporangiaceae bacterium]
MTAAAESVPGTDPDRASFTIALQTAIDTVTTVDNVIPAASSHGRIGHAVLDGLLAPRRPWVSVRKVKSLLSRWNKADPHRPARSTPLPRSASRSSAGRLVQRLSRDYLVLINH